MSDPFAEFDGTLDLTGADESAGIGFEPVPSGRYRVHIDEGTEWRQTRGGPSASLPEGTWYLAVWLRCDETEPRELNGEKIPVKNKVFFYNLFNPPADYDPTKAANMKGSMLNFLLAAGYSKDEIEKKGFKVLPDKLVGRELTAVVARRRNRESQEYENNVTGVKSASSTASAEAGALI